MKANKTEIYNLTYTPEQLREVFIKHGLPISANQPFSFAINNGNLIISWSTESVAEIKETK